MTPAVRSVIRTPASPPEPGPRTAARPAASRYASAQLDPRPDAAAQARHFSWYSADPAKHAEVTGSKASHARTRANIAEAVRRGVRLMALPRVVDPVQVGEESQAERCGHGASSFFGYRGSRTRKPWVPSRSSCAVRPYSQSR